MDFYITYRIVVNTLLRRSVFTTMRYAQV